MIEFKTLSWDNMFSYGERNFIDFTKARLSQLSGKNGHGKTSILHILEEILYNKNSKGYKKSAIINRNTKLNNYSGTVTFSVDSVDYTLSVKRINNAQKVTLLSGIEDISAHTATGTFDLVEKILKIDFKMMSQLIGQNSKNSLSFLTATDTNRKRFLIDLLNYDNYLEIYEKAKEIHKLEADNLRVMEAEYKHLQEWITSNSKIPLDKYLLLEEPSIPNSLINDIKELTAEIASITTTTSNIRKNNQYRELRDSISLDSLVEPIKFVDLTTYRSTQAILKSDINSIGKKLEKIKSFHGHCVSCYQSISEEFTAQIVEECNTELKAKNIELVSITNIISNQEKLNQRHQKLKKQIEDFEKYSSLIDPELPTEEPNKSDLEQRLENLKTTYNNLATERKRVLNINETYKSNNTRIELILSQKAALQLKIDRLKKEIEEQIELVTHLDILKKTFSTNGLVSFKLENSVQELQILANKYLEDLSGGRFLISFVLVGEKLNVVIKDNSVDVDIEALSAGELTRVTTATLLAIRTLMATMSRNTVNLLFLDEVIDSLDAEGREQLIDILLKETNLNTLLVSHSYSHPLLQTINVIKEGNISRLEQ